MFCQVLAIFSFTEVVSNGYYRNRSEKTEKNVLDTFFICAEMTKVIKRRDDKHFSFLPYSVYKLRATSGKNMKPYLLTLSVDEIYRPACFVKVFHSEANNSNPSFCFSDRFYCFDLLFCDRSFWNSNNDDQDIPPPFAADSPDDTTGFVLSSEQQLLTYNTVLENQQNIASDDSDTYNSAEDSSADDFDDN